MNNELGRFNLRIDDLEVRSCSQSIMHAIDPNHRITIDLVKWKKHEDKEYCSSLGYFEYLEPENCWEFKFIGDKPFKEISDKEIQTVWIMLQVSYDILQTMFVNTKP